jgi:ferredoxin-type protein NapG
MMPNTDDQPMGRRDFFAVALKKLLAPAAEYLDEKLNRLVPPEARVAIVPRIRLRPPGALPEPEFQATCIHSGTCAEVCPVQAIRLWEDDGTANAHTPYIEASLQACVVCQTIECTRVCPSGALTPLTSPDQIHMGFARMDYDRCARAHGEVCRICVEKCPLPNAIRVGADGRIEILEGCVGCGVCEMHCPSQPAKAITVQIV